MKRDIYLSILAAWVAAGVTTAAERPPNVVIIMGDDVGIGDVGVYGSKLIPTPNIDHLAAEGIRFTDGHATASTCSPSRFSLLTGIHDFRHNINILSPVAPLTIPTDVLTLPKMFQEADYATAVIGKWHLGIGAKGTPVDWNGEVKPGPLEIGFDQSFILPTTNDRVPTVYLDGHHELNLDPKDPLFISSKKPVKTTPENASSTRYPNGTKNPEAMTHPAGKGKGNHANTVTNGIGRIDYMVGGKSALWKDEDMADVLMERAKEFMRENKNKPFFLYFPSQDIHVPRAPHQRFVGKTELGYRGDAMVQMDWSTGEIMKTLEELGIADDTIVIFTSDNGPTYGEGYFDESAKKSSGDGKDHDGSGIYSGGKYEITEGGTLVPFIIRWPGKIKPGAVSDALVSQIDLMASFAGFIGVELEKDEGPDSRDTLAAFLGKSKKGQEFIIEYSAGRLALRRGDWKYIEAAKRDKTRGLGNSPLLFNLADDPGEKKNVIKENPELAGSMATQLSELSKKGASLRN